MELTPQQSLFAAYYLDPTSSTFSNALQSALKAGFSEEYANNITGQMPKWLSELLGKKKRLLMKAEKVLEDTLDGEDKKLAQDSAKFIAKTVGKEDYSERTELTGKNGDKLQINLVQFDETSNDTPQSEAGAD